MLLLLISPLITNITLMKITYDKHTDTLYLEFKDTTVTTKRLSDDIAVDYDSDGKMAGIEVLGARKHVAADWKKVFAVEYQENLIEAVA